MRKCIVCNSESKKTFFDSSVSVPVPYPLNGRQSIVQCQNCSFIYSDSENTVEDYHKYYLELNKHKKRANDAQDLDRTYFDKIIKLISGLEKDAAILDFGSGDLLMQSMLHEKGFANISTYDIDSEAEYEDKYDLILTTHTFEHIMDADIVLAKLKKYLRKNGQLLIAVPNLLGYLEHYCGAYNWFDMEHINHFSPDSLTRFVESKGFEVSVCISDKREVRPGLYYPEVIIICNKGDLEKRQNRYEANIDIQILEKYVNKSEDDFSQSLKKYKSIAEKSILFWGLGISAMRFINHIENISNLDFVDADSRLWGRNIKGKIILSSAEITDVKNYDLILIMAVNYKFIEQYVREKFGDEIRIVTL